MVLSFIYFGVPKVFPNMFPKNNNRDQHREKL